MPYFQNTVIDRYLRNVTNSDRQRKDVSRSHNRRWKVRNPDGTPIMLKCILFFPFSSDGYGSEVLKPTNALFLILSAVLKIIARIKLLKTI